MDEQKNFDSKKCFVYFTGVFLIGFIILFAILKLIFTFAVITDSNNTPLQIAINCSILILSTAVSWLIAYLYLRKQNFSEEHVKPIIKKLIVFICTFTVIYLVIYLTMAIIDINDAKLRLDALKKSVSENTVYEYSEFTKTITTIPTYVNRKLTYVSISFLALLISNLAALLIISNLLHLRFHPELKRERKPKTKANKKTYDTQMVENTNKPVQPTPVKVQQTVNQVQNNNVQNNQVQKTNYDVQQIEK